MSYAMWLTAAPTLAVPTCCGHEASSRFHYTRMPSLNSLSILAAVVVFGLNAAGI